MNIKCNEFQFYTISFPRFENPPVLISRLDPITLGLFEAWEANLDFDWACETGLDRGCD